MNSHTQHEIIINKLDITSKPVSSTRLTPIHLKFTSLERVKLSQGLDVNQDHYGHFCISMLRGINCLSVVTQCISPATDQSYPGVAWGISKKLHAAVCLELKTGGRCVTKLNQQFCPHERCRLLLKSLVFPFTATRPALVFYLDYGTCPGIVRNATL